MMQQLTINNETELETVLSTPDNTVIDLMRRLQGDIIILGIAGKIGISLGRMAVEAIRLAGVSKKVYGVSRFSTPGAREKLEAYGIETIACDLLDRKAVAALPPADNVIFMAGRKFGTGGSEELTWAMNTLVPGNVGEKYHNSAIVAFSTGCVYPLVNIADGGCDETTAPAPVGEYAQSCLGRERVFDYYSRHHGCHVLQFRLNYAIDLRYGVLYDIAEKVWNEQPVINSVGHFNVIWQGDVNRLALLCLEHCQTPAAIMNITGPETVTTTYIAEKIGRLLNKKVSYSNPVSGTSAYLNNAAKSFALFGYPQVSLDNMLKAQAEWIANGQPTLNKPTHFEVNNGKF